MEMWHLAPYFPDELVDSVFQGQADTKKSARKEVGEQIAVEG